MTTGRAGDPWLPACLSVKSCESDETNSFSSFLSSLSSSCVRSDTAVYRGTEERSFHGSMPRLDHPLSTHSSLHQIDCHSRHGSQRDVSEASPTLITHGTTASDSQAAENEGTSAWEEPGSHCEDAVDAFLKGRFPPGRHAPVCLVCKCFPLWRWRMYQWVLWWWLLALAPCWSFVGSAAKG